MIVSWNWLKQYVPLTMSVAELERRLMMAGLNHESTTEVGGDLAIDLEVTSNRPDCLGHIGIAREAAVLWGSDLTLPAASPAEGKTPVDSLVKVRIDCPDLCLRYTARVVRGVKIGPSPKAIVRRLETVGIAPINNVVDISNYVLMEVGQPLHTFDFAKLEGETGTGSVCAQHPEGRSAANGACPPFPGAEIIVRRPLPGEVIEAIDHKAYVLGSEMCMICDARRPVAIGGVMGGAQTEISPATRDVLVEAAEFDPVSIRNTARQLNLHSDSSYRFERRIDPEGLDWASRRCCELILEIAGGELAAGVVDVGQPPPTREPIVLRLSQIERILGIPVPDRRVREILMALGNEVSHPQSFLPHPLDPTVQPTSITVVPPSWRRDLTREIDLIEEVGRIHGYDAIPEDVGVPMVPSARRRDDRVFERVRRVLTAAGFDEALTLSVVDAYVFGAFSPWSDAEPLRTEMPVLRGADCLRRSLIPSLLGVQQINESVGMGSRGFLDSLQTQLSQAIQFFEIAKVYLPQGNELPREEVMLGATSTRRFPWRGVEEGKPMEQSYRCLKGVIESIFCDLKITAQPEAQDSDISILDPELSCRLVLDGELIGYVGVLTTKAIAHFHLIQETVVAELRLSPLINLANLVPTVRPLSPFPAISRDISLVVNEPVRWADIAETARANGGHWLESVVYGEVYRSPDRLGTDKKSLFFTITLRSSDGTLTSQQADEVRDRIVAACRTKHGAELRV